MSNDLKRNLKKKQLCDRYSVNEKTIDRWRKAGTLPPPDFWIAQYPYWIEEKLDEFDRQRSKAPEQPDTAA
jgi:hypothetical protein